ncbi:MAG TPA: permease-like cell division protein FtsX [Candidatus Dojkabacteria bacterium]|nr:permease-like cell division protein FtsX [Candidatus Dojkabacteria bacterium]HRP51726.1 permease-like cell division protein FtsX [Candidatus Dojkabacteria bacterium]
MSSFKRAFKNTTKQIKRSGWLAIASVFVMTLAFFISSIFTIIAFTSNLFLNSIENKPHIYVFFKSGTSEEEIIQKQNEWQNLPEVSTIEYTTESQALEEFKDVQERVNPDIAETIRSDVLPASLGIRLYSISDAENIINLVTEEQETNENIFAIRFSKETIDTIRTLFYWIRLGGGILMGLLLLVIFFFTLLTVEFRTFIRSEEIGIMQLVGGSLWFIRLPFIIEGMIYGLIGALISTLTLSLISYYVLVVERNSNAVTFVYNLLGGLKWPSINFLDVILGVLAVAVLGALIGAFNSIVAIRRYIN